MADTRQKTTWGSRFRFLIRTVGLTGVAAVAFGGMLAAATLPKVDFGSWAGLKAIPDLLRAAGSGEYGELAKVGAWMVACGVAAVVIALVVELLSGIALGVGRRAAAHTTETIGIIAAVVLLVLVNAYSFTHYGRYDVTRDQRFTLKPELAAELAKLRASSPTTIVVLQKHRMFGTLTDERDSYTKAAEEKVTEKVRDLVDQFREFGPQFKVEVLDTEAFGYSTHLESLTKDAPELRTAIESAPENSILFYANKRVQRLSFNEFMQLDKTASKATEGAENLVLLPQGVDTFARRILAVQERRPKVAVCVVHELLTTGADDPENRFSLAGLKKSLTAQGFDVVDVVLKKGWNNARSINDLKPAADTREESKLERLEGELDDADAELASARSEVTQLTAILDYINKLKSQPWKDRKAFYERIALGNITEDVEPQIIASLKRTLKRSQDNLTELQKKKEEAEKNLAVALKDERPLQDRRMTDVTAKFSKQLADVDLLVIARFTVEDAMKGPGVEANLHALNREQIKVAKDFMKRGKPVLAFLGPITPQVAPSPGEPSEEFEKRLAIEIGNASDGFERLLAERGIELGRSVILFEGETKSLAGGDPFAGGRPSEVPPISPAEPPSGSKLKPNPVAAAYRLTGRAAEQKLDIKLRALRPVAIAPAWQAKQPFAAEIASTTGESWSELRPYPRLTLRSDGSRGVSYAPKYEPVDINDPKKGTRDEERRGPFSIGVAIENKIPAAWMTKDLLLTEDGPLRSPYSREEAAAAILAPFDSTFAVGLTVAASKLDRPTQRTVVYGSGNIFTGAELKPPQEKLLLHTVNWLTNRADRLPQPATSENPEWHYPRVAMSARDRTLWRLGTVIGLPLVVAYAGLLAMMRRRMR